MKITTLVSQFEFTPELKQEIEQYGELIHQSVTKIDTKEIIKRLENIDIAIIGSSGVKEKVQKYSITVPI